MKEPTPVVIYTIPGTRPIAQTLHLSEANCQQIYRRAKQHVATGRTRARIDAAAADRVVEEFLAAALNGDIEQLVKLLTDDAVSVADGGGRVPARNTPIVGALGIARYLRGLLKPTAAKQAMIGGSYAMHPAVVNGGPAALGVIGDQVVGVMSFDVSSDGINAVYIQVNPTKLAHLAGQWSTSGIDGPLSGGGL